MNILHAFLLLHVLLMIVCVLGVRTAVDFELRMNPRRRFERRARLYRGIWYSLALFVPELVMLFFAVVTLREVWRAGR